ncbi:sensor histidine kinase [Streptomyces sp. NPDC048172]|uniref:sensor histidine kinase n=1 Tax=Streptomyces sp. NPDC048172 TaxID=3365505 RepID=UPI003713A052
MHDESSSPARPSVGDGVRAVLRAPFARRAWGEVAYCLVGFPLALVGFVLVAVLLALGAGLTATLVGAVLGLLLLVAGTALARVLAGLRRGLAAGLLGERVAAPGPFRPGSGAFGRLDARLRDATGWRAVAYVAASLPVATVGAYAFAWWTTALVNLTAPVRWAVFGQHPVRPGESMPVLTPLPFGGAPHVTTFAGTFVAVAVGAVSLLIAPWFTRGVVAVDRWLIRSLLGPGALAERVRALEETRALAVDDSAALLRRLERDLHDGAQVRLVALAMTLDMAKERVRDGVGVSSEEAARLRGLLDSAHLNATEALTELRDLARGIHPPALDDGLPDALATLAARSAVPVELAVDVPERPTEAIETIAYFCAAELLTNVIKHSGAGRATLTVRDERGMLVMRVTDDGRGGAEEGGGSGLTGLAQRVRTVDGTVRVESPRGGPTVVTVSLPFHA